MYIHNCVYCVYIHTVYINCKRIKTNWWNFIRLYQCPKFNGLEPAIEPINVGYNAILSSLLSKYVRRNCLQLRMIIHTSERRPVFGRTLGLSQKFGTSKDFEPSAVYVYVSYPEWPLWGTTKILWFKVMRNDLHPYIP